MRDGQEREQKREAGNSASRRMASRGETGVDTGYGIGIGTGIGAGRTGTGALRMDSAVAGGGGAGAGAKKRGEERESGYGRPWGRGACRLWKYMSCGDSVSFGGVVPLRTQAFNRVVVRLGVVCERILARLGWHTTKYARLYPCFGQSVQDRGLRCVVLGWRGVKANREPGGRWGGQQRL